MKTSSAEVDASGRQCPLLGKGRVQRLRAVAGLLLTVGGGHALTQLTVTKIGSYPLIEIALCAENTFGRRGERCGYQYTF